MDSSAMTDVEYVGYQERRTAGKKGKRLEYYLIESGGKETLCAIGEETNQGDAHYYYTNVKDFTRHGILACHNRRELHQWLDAIIAGSGRGGSNIKVQNGAGDELTKTEYVSYQQEKFLFPDGRKGIRFYLVDKDGNSFPAVLGEERDTRDGHYMYRREESFTEGTPLCCGNLAGVHKWIRELLTSAAVEDMIERGMFKRSAFGSSNSKRHRSETRSSSKAQMGDRGAAGNKAERAKKAFEDFTNRERAKFEAQAWIGHTSQEDIETVNRILKLLDEHSMDAPTAIAGLRELSNVFMCVPIFRRTKAAEEIAKLRNHPCKELAGLASSLLEQWKKQLTRKLAILTTVFRPHAEILASRGETFSLAVPKAPSKENLELKPAALPPLPPPEDTPLAQKKRMMDAMIASPKASRQASPPPTTPRSTKKQPIPSTGQKLPLGKGRKLCEACNLVVGSPTRVCPYCQAHLPLKNDLKVSKAGVLKPVFKKGMPYKPAASFELAKASSQQTDNQAADGSMPSSLEEFATQASDYDKKKETSNKEVSDVRRGSGKRTARKLNLTYVQNAPVESTTQDEQTSDTEHRDLRQTKTRGLTDSKQRKPTASEGTILGKRGSAKVAGVGAKKRSLEKETSDRRPLSGRRGHVTTSDDRHSRRKIAALPEKPTDVKSLIQFLDSCRQAANASPHEAMENLVKEAVAASTDIFEALPDSDNLLKRLKRLENKVASIKSAHRVSDQTQVKREVVTLIDNLLRVLNN